MKTEGARAKNRIFLLFYFCSRAFLKWKNLKCLDYETKPTYCCSAIVR